MGDLVLVFIALQRQEPVSFRFVSLRIYPSIGEIKEVVPAHHQKKKEGLKSEGQRGNRELRRGILERGAQMGR